MHKACDVPQTPPEHPEVERYKTLARLAEERAREIRRIAALERARFEERLLEQERLIRTSANELGRLKEDHGRLRERFEGVRQKAERFRSDLSAAKAELRKLRRAQDRIVSSRAHRLATAYVRFASSGFIAARTSPLIRPVARILNRVRRALA